MPNPHGPNPGFQVWETAELPGFGETWVYKRSSEATTDYYYTVSYLA